MMIQLHVKSILITLAIILSSVTDVMHQVWKRIKPTFCAVVTLPIHTEILPASDNHNPN